MRNDYKSKIKRIIYLTERLPYFQLDDLVGIESNKNYLKILLSRYKKKGKIISLKKGVYTTKEYIDNIQKSDKFSFYSEFISGILYKQSYLSLDYVLYKHNILTEIPVNFTLITKNKTAYFSNSFGNFFYHKIKNNLFCGFEILQKGDFIIYEATKAKALFDFLYLRKNLIFDKKTAKELRLNLKMFNLLNKKELIKYIKIEGSKKMKDIFKYLFS
ncbi:MAG: hypothetical protein V1910_02775 [bacterium]